MARLPSITSKSQVSAQHHAIFDGVVTSRGAVQGPFTMLMHCPPLAEHLMHLGGYVRFEGELDKRVRVLAAMAVAREYDAVYIWGAQTGTARKLGVPETTITAIRENHSKGLPPEYAANRSYVRDLLQEYRDASAGMVGVRFVDVEDEAGKKEALERGAGTDVGGELRVVPVEQVAVVDQRLQGGWPDALVGVVLVQHLAHTGEVFAQHRFLGTFHVLEIAWCGQRCPPHL